MTNASEAEASVYRGILDYPSVPFVYENETGMKRFLAYVWLLGHVVCLIASFRHCVASLSAPLLENNGYVTWHPLAYNSF